jgi:hypothetical protein
MVFVEGLNIELEPKLVFDCTTYMDRMSKTRMEWLCLLLGWRSQKDERTVSRSRARPARSMVEGGSRRRRWCLGHPP